MVPGGGIVKFLFCPWCGGNAKVLYLDDAGDLMFMCLQCDLTDSLDRLVRSVREAKE